MTSMVLIGLATSPPTFRQFVQDLLDGGFDKVFSDAHWRPQWLTCAVCGVDYHVPGFLAWSSLEAPRDAHAQVLFTGHMETLVEDSDYISKAAGTDIGISHLNARSTRSVNIFTTLCLFNSWPLAVSTAQPRTTCHSWILSRNWVCLNYTGQTLRCLATPRTKSRRHSWKIEQIS